MAFVISGLPDYVDQTSTELVTKSVVESKTINYLQSKDALEVDVKGKKAINVLDTTLVVASGAECGFTPGGSTTFSQVTLEVVPLKSDEAYCQRELASKWLNKSLQRGQNYTELVFADELMRDKASKIALYNEKLIWQGDTDSADANLNKLDGFLKLLADGGAHTLSTSGDAVSQLQQIVAGIDSDVIGSDDLVIFVGEDRAMAYQIALANKNLFDPASPLKVLGTDVDIVGVPGLNGTNKAVAGRASHLIVGTDLVSDASEAKLWHSNDDDNFKMSFHWTIGAAVAFPEDFLVATMAAPSSAYSVQVSTMSVDEQNITNSTVENQTVTGA